MPKGNTRSTQQGQQTQFVSFMMTVLLLNVLYPSTPIERRSALALGTSLPEILRGISSQIRSRRKPMVDELLQYIEAHRDNYLGEFPSGIGREERIRRLDIIVADLREISELEPVKMQRRLARLASSIESYDANKKILEEASANFTNIERVVTDIREQFGVVKSMDITTPGGLFGCIGRLHEVENRMQELNRMARKYGSHTLPHLPKLRLGDSEEGSVTSKEELESLWETTSNSISAVDRCVLRLHDLLLQTLRREIQGDIETRRNSISELMVDVGTAIDEDRVNFGNIELLKHNIRNLSELIEAKERLLQDGKQNLTPEVHAELEEWLQDQRGVLSRVRDRLSKYENTIVERQSAILGQIRATQEELQNLRLPGLDDDGIGAKLIAANQAKIKIRDQIEELRSKAANWGMAENPEYTREMGKLEKSLIEKQEQINEITRQLEIREVRREEVRVVCFSMREINEGLQLITIPSGIALGEEASVRTAVEKAERSIEERARLKSRVELQAVVGNITEIEYRTLLAELESNFTLKQRLLGIMKDELQKREQERTDALIQMRSALEAVERIGDLSTEDLIEDANRIASEGRAAVETMNRLVTNSGIPLSLEQQRDVQNPLIERLRQKSEQIIQARAQLLNDEKSKLGTALDRLTKNIEAYKHGFRYYWDTFLSYVSFGYIKSGREKIGVAEHAKQAGEARLQGESSIKELEEETQKVESANSFIR